MGTSPREVSGEGGGSDQPAMVQDSAGTYVAQNEDALYEQPDWEWLAADQFLEGNA